MDLREYISYLTVPWAIQFTFMSVPLYTGTYNNTLTKNWGLL